MILTSQDNVKQDDPAGPCEIGKYQFEGGAGKSVKQDVPDDPGLSWNQDVFSGKSPIQAAPV